MPTWRHAVISTWQWDEQKRARVRRVELDGVPYTAATVTETEPNVFEAIVYEQGHKRAHRTQWPWMREAAEEWCDIWLRNLGLLP